jgi:hypothetical protein
MKTNKLRFIVFLLMFSLVAVACGGDTADEVAEAPDTTEAPKRNISCSCNHSTTTRSNRCVG